ALYQQGKVVDGLPPAAGGRRVDQGVHRATFEVVVAPAELAGERDDALPDGKVTFTSFALADFHPPASWSVDKNRVVLVIDGKAKAFAFTVLDWAFERGKRIVPRLYLVEDGGDDVRFLLGAVRDDCEY